MNNVCLVGRLTKDPELRNTASGTPVCNFTLAVDRRFKSENQPTADFINVVSWSSTAEFVANYFNKGMRVFVVGRIQTRTWEDNDGKKHYATEVVSNEVGFADGKKDGDNKPGLHEEVDEDDVPF